MYILKTKKHIQIIKTYVLITSACRAMTKEVYSITEKACSMAGTPTNN